MNSDVILMMMLERFDESAALFWSWLFYGHNWCHHVSMILESYIPTSINLPSSLIDTLCVFLV
jgi:hypothetical protein